jgi:hypothetical protein
MLCLSASEREEVESWTIPTDITLDDGHVLKYEDAVKEREVMFDKHGRSTQNLPDAVSVGHADLYWVVDHLALPKEGQSVEEAEPCRVLYLGDLKKTAFSSADGLSSLQLIGYAMSLASEHNCDGFAIGIWNITEAEWDWSGEFYDFSDGEKMEGIAHRLVAAATNTDGEYATGPHCGNCYSRRHCQEYLLPVMDPFSVFGPLHDPGGITAENATEILDAALRTRILAEIAIESCKAYVKVAGAIPMGEGKEWRETISPGGKRKLNAKALTNYFTSREEHADFLEQFMTTTKRRSAGCREVNVKKA